MGNDKLQAALEAVYALKREVNFAETHGIDVLNGLDTRTKHRHVEAIASALTTQAAVIEWLAEVCVTGSHQCDYCINRATETCGFLECSIPAKDVFITAAFKAVGEME